MKYLPNIRINWFYLFLWFLVSSVGISFLTHIFIVNTLQQEGDIWQINVNPFAVGGCFGQYKMMQKSF